MRKINEKIGNDREDEYARLNDPHMGEVIIDDIDYHRNGVSGVGFHVVIFTVKDEKEVGKPNRKMIGIVFQKMEGSDQCYSVFDRELVGQGHIQMHDGENSNAWRGDNFIDTMNRAIEIWDKREDEKIRKMRTEERKENNEKRK